MSLELRMGAFDIPAERVRTAALVGGIAFFGLLVRIGWLLWHGVGEITWDGAEYARLAQNLVSGGGYTGIRGHTQFVFPPLYSLAIAALLPLTGDAERAGIIVSLVAGAGFIVAVYAIGAQHFGRRVGLVAALLAALLPFVVQLATVVLADTLFLALAAGGLALLGRTVRLRRLSDAVGCGALFGLAYLTRPEGLLLAATAVLCVAALGALRPRALVLAACVAAPFCILAAPYIGFLSVHAGHVRIEGKSLLNLDIGLRMNAGMSYTVAADAIDAQLRQLGPELDDGYYFEPSGRRAPSTLTVLGFAASNSVRHLREIANVLRSRLCGTILVTLLMLAGIAIGPWNRERLAGEVVLWAYAATVFVALGSVYHFWERYAVGFMPLIVVWAARGASIAGDAVAQRLGSRWWRAVPVALTAILLCALLFATRERFTDDAPTVFEKTAGTWLAAHDRAGDRILAISDQSVYYARGIWAMLPAAPDASVALRYVAQQKPDYVVLNREYAAERPYVVAWLDHGIPDRRAQLVDRIDSGGVPVVAIYRWSPIR